MRRKEQVQKKSYAVFGMGEFGKSVAMGLSQQNVDVLAIDQKEEKIADVADYVTDVRIMDVKDTHAYEKLGLSNMDGVIVAITGNMEATIMVILQAVEAGVKDIVVKAINDTQAKIFAKIGATSIINPEKNEGARLSRTLPNSDLHEYVELKEGICMMELSVPKEWVGKSLVELNLRNKYQINVIALLHNGVFNMQIDPNVLLKAEEHLLVVTDYKTAEKIGELYS